jgi:hypothetical protein
MPANSVNVVTEIKSLDVMLLSPLSALPGRPPLLVVLLDKTRT